MTDIEKMKEVMSSTWVKTAEVQANRLDMLYDELSKELQRTQSEILYYIIAWNNGVSGAAIDPVAALAMKEMTRRGQPYTDEIGEAITELFA